VMFSEKYNFPWGGAMAMLRAKMEVTHLHEIWETAVSDDLSLNQALHQRGYQIEFIPQCTVITFSQATARSFLQWATRQVAITRAFNRPLWNYGLAAYSSFTLLTLFGIASLVAGITFSTAWLLPAALLLTPSILGIFRSSMRVTAFARSLPEFASKFEGNRWAHSIGSLIVPWIMTYCIIKSARMNEITWRDRKYKLTGQTTVAPSPSISQASPQKRT